ncbi:MAG TPA: CinA family protein [Microthrixaceae bacterium]|nr:CinA family protein [Microthrixaceae bacterium]
MDDEDDEDLEQLAVAVTRTLRRVGRTIGVAESLTSGQLAALLGCAPGSGDVFAGGFVTYSRSAKERVLGVSPESVVDVATALQMAQRARALLDVDLCVSLTGVAGPERQDDVPVGTVFIGWASRTDAGVDRCCFGGEPDEIRSRSCQQALRRLLALADAQR